MDRLTSIAAFARTVESGSFTAASAILAEMAEPSEALTKLLKLLL
jgi:hypothetical protein